MCEYKDMCFSYNIKSFRFKDLCETDWKFCCGHYLHYQNKPEYVKDVREYLKVRGLS